MADDEGWERRMYSKDLIKTHHGMFYCDSREPGRGVCVCSLQLWIISTLFSLWPTCAERRMCPRVPAPVLFSLCGCRGVEGSPYGKPDVNSKWSLSAGDNQGHKRHPRCMFPLTVQSLCRLHCSVPAVVLLEIVAGLNTLFTSPSSFPCDVFFWSPWKTPNSVLLHSLWNQFSLFCSYSLWVTMDTAPAWFGWCMNLFMSVNLDWRGMFFYLLWSQSK